jgi:hypothetical protein
MKLLIMKFSLTSHFTSLGPNILLSALGLCSSAEGPPFRELTLMELDISADTPLQCKRISYWLIPPFLSGISLSRQIYCCLDGDGFEATDEPHLWHSMSKRTTLQMAFLPFQPPGEGG